MAQWDGIDRAASIAQLVGVDALGLISTIVQAAQAVHRNKETCQELVQDVQLIHDLLRMLQDPEMMQRVEIVNALNGLEGTLREAYTLVSSCRDCSAAYRIFMGWKQTDQFRRVKKKIAKHLRFYPMISHADITRRLERLGNSVQSTCSSQDAEGVLTSSTSHSNPDARTEDSLEPVELERFQTENESIALEENQQAGHQEVVEALSARKWRFRLPWKKVETARIRELIGPGFPVFHFTQLSAATNNFAHECKIGSSCSFGHIYKGRLHDGLSVMIKRSSNRYESDSEAFENEVRFLAKLRHKNIVKLIGCCIERGEKLLVYEYMANGRLVDAITGTRTRALLNWSERFKIIIGIAHGVVYLHDCCGIRIVHRDLNPGRILLDSDMTPKITDFALAKIYGLDGREEHEGELAGTVGYMDPEYFTRGGVYPVKSDVYGFGITLLEIITGKRCHALFKDEGDNSTLSSPDQSWQLQPLTKLLRLWTMGRAMELIDPVLHDEPRMAEIMRCIQIAVLCAEPNREDRPTMWDVLLMLSCESMTLPVPKLPESQDSTQDACEGELSDSDITEPKIVYVGDLSPEASLGSTEHTWRVDDMK